MTQPACGPYTDGYIASEVPSNILPEGESFTSYRNDHCLSARPRREKVREEISDYILLMLGAPQVRVELDAQALTLVVDEALKKFEEHAPRYYYEYYHFKTVPNEARYELPCDVGWIRSVNYLQNGQNCAFQELGGVYPYATAFAGMSWGAFHPSTPFWGNLGEWALYQGYRELFNRVTNNEGSWEILSDNTIMLYPNPMFEMHVTVEYLQSRKDWQYVESWIKEYALCLAKEIVGRIRSKYERLVSPGGGITLDGQRLLTESETKKTQLEELLVSRFDQTHMLPVVG